MPNLTVKIKYDQPPDPNWLNGANVALALHAYCPGTKFEVIEIEAWSFHDGGEIDIGNYDDTVED